jgi:tRNA pseudouridine55 synthase
VGHVASLRRLRLGPFTTPDMHNLEAVDAAAARPETLDALLLPPDAALPGLPAVSLGAVEQACILRGQPVFATGPGSARVRMYDTTGRFLGIGRMTAEGRRLAPERIMVDLAGAAARQA